MEEERGEENGRKGKNRYGSIDGNGGKTKKQEA